jgi:hypothetical protein
VRLEFVMLIKKADVKAHMAARRARHMQLSTNSPSVAGSGNVPVQPEPMRANAHGSALKPIRLVPRMHVPSAATQGVPRPAVQEPAQSNGTTTVFKPSEW